MTERLLLTIVVLAGLVVIGGLIRHLTARHAESTRAFVRLEPAPNAGARILVFAGPGCSSCRVQQTIIDELVDDWPQPVAIQTIDALEQPDLASQFGVRIVPTTVVATPDGRIVGINSGLATADRLTQQLHNAA